MKKLLLLLMMKTIPVVIFAQSYSGNWIYTTKTDPFDGTYKIASTFGEGSYFPYEKPCLKIWVIKDELKMAISDVPGISSEDIYIKITFDKQKIYTPIITTGKNALFIDLTDEKMYNDLKTYSKIYMRISTTNISYDCTFDLTGSTIALNYVGVPKEWF